MEQSFRTVMFGFNKEDVAKFIYQQNKGYEKKLAEKEKEVERLTSALEKAEDQCRAAEENAALTDSFRESVVSCKDSCDALLAAMDAEADELSRMGEGYGALKEQCEKLLLFKEKAKKFDSLATALSGIFGNGPEGPSGDYDDQIPEERVSPVEEARVHLEERRELAEKLAATFSELNELVDRLPQQA